MNPGAPLENMPPPTTSAYDWMLEKEEFVNGGFSCRMHDCVQEED